MIYYVISSNMVAVAWVVDVLLYGEWDADFATEPVTRTIKVMSSRQERATQMKRVSEPDEKRDGRIRLTPGEVESPWQLDARDAN